MKVFLSWSGEGSQSHQVAKALRDWLPNVIQRVEPWISSQDIDSGINYGTELEKQLAETDFGILAVTRKSMIAPWVTYEAGALSKQIDRACVCPYLISMKPVDLSGPLSKLQSRQADRAGTLMLLETINKTLDKERQLDKQNLEESFGVWWPKLELTLEEIAIDSFTNECADKSEVRSDRELLEETLMHVRAQTRDQYNAKLALKAITQALKDIKVVMDSDPEHAAKVVSVLARSLEDKMLQLDRDSHRYDDD